MLTFLIRPATSQASSQSSDLMTIGGTHSGPNHLEKFAMKVPGIEPQPSDQLLFALIRSRKFVLDEHVKVHRVRNIVIKEKNKFKIAY